jgi:hypothetical protein
MKPSFEITTEDTIEVFFDSEGRDLLIHTLQKIKCAGDHDHLMTPSWAGHELSENAHGTNKLIHKVTLGIPRE